MKRKKPEKLINKFGGLTQDMIKLALKIRDVAVISESKEFFISTLENEGYQVDWTPEKKHITFTVPKENLKDKKNKFKLQDLNEHFNRELFTKEGLEYQFRKFNHLKEHPEDSNSKIRFFDFPRKDEFKNDL